MTRQKSFKHRVRARMAKTGESYTAARRMLIASGERPQPARQTFEPLVSAEKVSAATGRTWEQWFGVLDRWGAASHSHADIARWITAEHETSNWWAQTIAVSYERARGLRAPGQRPDGWVITASKTIAVPVERLQHAFKDPKVRERWLPGAQLKLRRAATQTAARYDWEDGSTRLNVGFTSLAEDKSRIALSHERLPDADTAEEMKAWWRERMDALKPLLEGAGARAGSARTTRVRSAKRAGLTSPP